MPCSREQHYQQRGRYMPYRLGVGQPRLGATERWRPGSWGRRWWTHSGEVFAMFSAALLIGCEDAWRGPAQAALMEACEASTGGSLGGEGGMSGKETWLAVDSHLDPDTSAQILDPLRRRAPRPSPTSAQAPRSFQTSAHRPSLPPEQAWTQAHWARLGRVGPALRHGRVTLGDWLPAIGGSRMSRSDRDRCMADLPPRHTGQLLAMQPWVQARYGLTRICLGGDATCELYWYTRTRHPTHGSGMSIGARGCAIASTPDAKESE